jgi:hypothetical protein
MRVIDQLDYLVATRQFENARQLAKSITSKGLTENINRVSLQSRGTFIPEEVESKLKELKKMTTL